MKTQTGTTDTQETQILTRAATFEASTFDADKRTVQVIFSTGAAVRRRDWDGDYSEMLDLNPKAVNLSQVIGGPLLDNHDRYGSVRSILGIVESAAVDGTRAVATVRSSSRADVDGLVQDVQSGVIRNISTGYTVEEWTESVDQKTGVRQKTATKWTPVEISLVQLAADPGATVRSEKRGNMKETTTQTAPPAGNEVEVRSIGQLAGLEQKQIDEMISRGITPKEARREALKFLEETPAPATRTATVTPAGYDDPGVRVRAMVDAVYMKVNPKHVPGEAARPYVNRRMADIARELLQVRGFETIGQSDATVIERALHTTSDYPLLLGDVANKTLREQMAAAPAAIKSIFRQATIPDFRTKYSLQLGQAPTLEKVNEAGEFTSGTIGEDRQGYSLDSYGRIFSVSRQLLVNDSLGAFSDIGRLFAQSAAQFEASFLVELITMNSGGGVKLSDTVNLFHASHGNLQTGGGSALAVAGLSAARLAMRKQLGLDGTTPLDISAKFLLVPAALETTAETLLTTIYAAQTSNVNPFAGKLTLLVDPRLDAKSTTRWYLAAAPELFPCLEYAYLADASGVQTEARAGFEVDGVQIKARLDFGAGALDFRGVVANVGA